MKIGITFNPYGNTYSRYGKQKFLKLKQHGYDAVDYNLADTETALYCLDEKELKQTLCAEKSAADIAGIQIFQVHGPWRWPPQDRTREELCERMDKMKKAAYITSLLGCDSLVIHPIMPFGIEDLLCDKQHETRAMNIEFFTALTGFAKQYGVTVCLENMPMRNFSLSKPEKISELVKEINDDNLKMCLDTGHVCVFPDLAAGDEIRNFGNYIKVLHIHDNMGEADSHMYPSKGITDWKDFADSLREVNFGGVLSLETSPSGELDDLAFEKESKGLCKMFRELVCEK